MKLRKLGLITFMASAPLFALTACGETNVSVSFDAYSNKSTAEEYDKKAEELFEEINKLDTLTCTYKVAYSTTEKGVNERVYKYSSDDSYKYDKTKDIIYIESNYDSTRSDNSYSTKDRITYKKQEEKKDDSYIEYDLLSNTYSMSSYSNNLDYFIGLVKSTISVNPWVQDLYDFYNDNGV